MVGVGQFPIGFLTLSQQASPDLLEAVRRDAEAFPNGQLVEELYGEVCRFLDDHEADPVAGLPQFIAHTRNRSFGLLASVRGYLRMLRIIEESDSLAFCNQHWADIAAGDVGMDPVFQALADGPVDPDWFATALFNGGVIIDEAPAPRHYSAIFENLPLFSRQPAVEGGEYDNDFPQDFAHAVNSTQLAELARHLVTDGQLNPDIFPGPNILDGLPAGLGDLPGSIAQAGAVWRRLNPGPADPAFHVIVSDIDTWVEYQGIFPAGDAVAGVEIGAAHYCQEIAERYQGAGRLLFLVAEPNNGQAAFDVTRFTHRDAGLRHTPTLGVRPLGNGRFDILLDLRLRIDVGQPNWIVAVVTA